MTISMLTEARARAILRKGDDLEEWVGDQPWRALGDGSWSVETVHSGWSFRVEPVPGPALRIIAQAPEHGPTTSWLVAGDE